MRYKECKDECENLCPYLAQSCESNSTCSPGCVCPDNTLFDGVECVAPGNCPCSVDEHIYEVTVAMFSENARFLRRIQRWLHPPM